MQINLETKTRGNRGGNVHRHVISAVATHVYTTKNLHEENKHTSKSPEKTIEGKKHPTLTNKS